MFVTFSDLQGIKTHAKQDGDDYIINRSLYNKWFLFRRGNCGDQDENRRKGIPGNEFDQLRSHR